MTKSKKSLIVGAALAGLLASGSAVQASNLLSSAKAGFNTATFLDLACRLGAGASCRPLSRTLNFK